VNLSKVTLRAYSLNADTRYHGRAFTKEADQSLNPSRDTFSDKEWPSLVIETGLSESEAQLRADVYWWFSNSDYKVNVVILFHIQRSPECRVTITLGRKIYFPLKELFLQVIKISRRSPTICHIVEMETTYANIPRYFSITIGTCVLLHPVSLAVNNQ
jgi:hypothetical protein